MGFSDLASASLRNNRNQQRTPTRKYWTEDRLDKRQGPEKRVPHTDLAARKQAAAVAKYV